MGQAENEWVRCIELGADDERIEGLLGDLAAATEGNFSDRVDELFSMLHSGLEEVVYRRCDRENRLNSRVYGRDDIVQDIMLRLAKSLRSKAGDAARLPQTVVQYERLIWSSIRFAFQDVFRDYFGANRLGANIESRLGTSSGSRDPRWVEAQLPQKTRGPSTRAEFNDALNALPADQAEIFYLRFFEKYTTAEVARMTEIDATTVRRRYKRAALALHPYLVK